MSYSGNLSVENRNGLIMSSLVWEATGTAERDAAMAMLQQVPGTGRVTVGGDKGFDTAEFVRECRNMHVTPHVAASNVSGSPGVDAFFRRVFGATNNLHSD